MRKRKGYKIFNIYDGFYKSVIVTDGCVIYSKKGWNKQNKKIQGPFAVFKTVKDAKRFQILGDEVLKKVEYKHSKEKILWYTCSGNKSSLNIKNCPYGTVLAKALKIL